MRVTHIKPLKFKKRSKLIVKDEEAVGGAILNITCCGICINEISLNVKFKTKKG